MDNTVKLWKRHGNKYQLNSTLERHEDWVTSVTEYKTGKDRLLLTKGNDDRAYVWEKYRLTAKQTPKDPCQKQKRNRVSNCTS
jgi:WD40 repeat protein